MVYSSESNLKSLGAVPFTLFMLVALSLAGCQADNSKLKRLDRQQGIGGLVLGDSLYSQIFRSFREQAEDYDPIETTVRGHVFTAEMPVDLGERFLFGVERGRVVANAVDGQIYNYTIRNPDISFRRAQALRDSLVSTFGPPTHVVDSLYVTDVFAGSLFSPTDISYEYLPVSSDMSKEEVLEMAIEKDLVSSSAQIDSTVSAPISRWQGQNVTMQFGAVEDEGFALSIFDRKSIGTVLSIQQAVDSTLRANTVRSFKYVGDLRLLTTKQNPLFRVEDLSSSNQTEITDHTVRYRSLQPFFGVANRRTYNGIRQAINADASFSSTTDSLKSLYVRMPKSFLGEPFMRIGEIREVLKSSLGNPALTATTTTSEGDFETLYWPGSPFSVVAREELIMDGTYVNFDRTKKSWIQPVPPLQQR